MQAIKLLQLSNLDLSAFVEEELERNPLLDRASDGPEAPVAGEPAAERAEYADSGSYGEDGGGEPSDMAAGSSGDGAGRGAGQAQASAVGRVGTLEPSTLPAVDVQAFS
jgi:DNA-directed RNA polymerase specialized sigma54-like protein